jgi:hypothetical protein
MTVAGASLFWMLFGALDVPAAAAGVTAHADAAAPAVSSGSNDPGDRCHGKRSGDPDDGDPCCEERCCRPEPSPRPSESPEPSAEATATSAPTSHPKRAASPAPRTPPAPAPVVAPRTGGISTTHTLPVPAREQEPPSGSRPPVLAPPELTIPAVTPVGADGAGVGAVPVIALTTVLVAATVAAVFLLLMRRVS